LRAAAGLLAHNADECVGQEALLMEMRVMKKGCGPSKQASTIAVSQRGERSQIAPPADHIKGPDRYL